MKMWKLATALAALTVSVGVATAASADTYDLNVSSAFPTGVTYGVVTTTQNGADVDVSVSLTSGYKFVNTGGHNTFTFNTNDPTMSVADVTNINLTGWTDFTPGANPSFGTFTIGLECTADSCKNGNGGAQTGPLTFTVQNTTLANFAPNASGFTFSADIVAPDGITTGAVGGAMPGVPEPATWAMMILGMGMVGAGLRMRRRPAFATA